MKKLLLGLGTLASIVAPITTIVACGTTSDPGTEGPSTPDNGNQNPGTDQASVDDEQTRVNAFTSTGATKQNELVATSTPFTSEIGLKYGLSVELHTDTFSYEYTSTVTGITIMVTKVSDESKPTVVPTEISVAPFVVISGTEANANSITKEQIESKFNITVTDTMLPSQVTGLPSSINVIPTTDAEAIVVVNLLWNANDVDGSLTWTASIDDRTSDISLTLTITGFKKSADVEKEKDEANANSITKAQVEAELTTMVPDSTKLPSQVTDLPNSVSIIPTTDSTTIVEVSLAWFANDVDGSLTWTASIDNRANDIILTSTITGFKDAATAKKENANSITRAQIEAKLTTITPDSTKLPSQVTGLPNSVSVIVTTDSKITVEVALAWSANDVDGSLVWTATIDGRTNTDALTSTITGFKISDDSSAEDARDNANSITIVNVQVELVNITADSTKLPSQVTGLPTSINVIPPANTTITVEVALVWSTNDVDGSLTWTASIDNRTNGVILTSTITGFKDAATAKIENANSITKAQVEAGLITVTPDSTKLPSQVTGLPNTIDITPTIDPTANVAVALTWTRDDYAGSLTWTAAINDRDNDVLLTGTITGFKLVVRNSFEGEFSTPEKEKEFLAITDTITSGAFFEEKLLTSVSLLEVTTIKDGAFSVNPFTSLYIPKAIIIEDFAFAKASLTTLSLPEATTFGRAVFGDSLLTTLYIPKAVSIGQLVFSDSLLTTLSLPEAITIGGYSFQNSPLTSLSVPKATSIGASAFKKIVNAASTTVTLPSSFNTDDQKNSIFGAGNWDQITFTWV